jgi:hypothetical protein
MKPRTISYETTKLRNMTLMHVSTHKKMKDDPENALNKNYGENLKKIRNKDLSTVEIFEGFPIKKLTVLVKKKSFSLVLNVTPSDQQVNRLSNKPS